MFDADDSIQVWMDDALVGVIRSIDGASARRGPRWIGSTSSMARIGDAYVASTSFQVMIDRRCVNIDRCEVLRNGPTYVNARLLGAKVPGYAVEDYVADQDVTRWTWLSINLKSNTDMALYERLFDHPDFEAHDQTELDLDRGIRGVELDQVWIDEAADILAGTVTSSKIATPSASSGTMTAEDLEDAIASLGAMPAPPLALWRPTMKIKVFSEDPGPGEITEKAKTSWLHGLSVSKSKWFNFDPTA